MSRPLPSWAQEPSKFSREERQEWKQWYDDPAGTKMHKDVGSRARPVSFGAKPGKLRRREVDDLYERMVQRGVVATARASR